MRRLRASAAETGCAGAPAGIRREAPASGPSAALALSALSALALSAFAWAETAEWSRFRGPNGGGAVEAGALPVEVGPDRNLLWRTAIPAGDSSPILSAKRIFLTASEDEALYTIALDRETGSELWRREAPRPRTETLDNRNGPASPSAVTDGERVWVFFGDFGLLCYTVDGEELWRHPLGPFDNIYGMGASPILAAGNVVLVVDQQRDSYILAVDAGSGEFAWRTERTAARSGHSTPTLHHPEGGELQIVVPGSFFLTGYSAATGERLWWVSGLSFEMKSTAAVEDGILFINGYAMPLNEEGRHVRLDPFSEVVAKHDGDGDGKISEDEAPEGLVRNLLSYFDLAGDGHLDEGDWTYFQAALDSRNGILAIELPEAGLRGDLTASHTRWTYHRKIPQLPSPIVDDGVLLMVDDSGITTTLRSATGELIEQGRLEGAVDSFYASPIVADGKFYLLSRSGKLVVLPSDGSLEPLAVSDLDDLATATPAIDGKTMYLRTRSALWAFQRSADDSPAGR